jgi:SAM-dependent methyltransferase
VAYPERIIPDETSRGIVAIHLKRYEFARRLCAGKRVLDAACGVGYGTAYLAEAADTVVGVDVDETAVAYARERYARPNVEYLAEDLLDLSLPDASFDAVVSFETIEHVPDQERYLAHVKRVLRPNGFYVVSTPRADVTNMQPENPFHETELSRADFERLLRKHFDDIELFGQRRLQTARHRLMQRLDVLGLRKRLGALRPASRLLGTPAMAEVSLDDLVIDKERIDSATELVAVCGRPRR